MEMKLEGRNQFTMPYEKRKKETKIDGDEITATLT